MRAEGRSPGCRRPSIISDERRGARMPAPTFAFLIRRPAHFIALGFGAGLAPVMPGTFGTLVAFPIAWWLQGHAGAVGWLATIAGLTVIGAWSAQVTGTALGSPDDGSIVIDEIAAFGLFRLFDIVKPPPIRQLDAAIKNGVGVMLDDFVAAAYALIVLAVAVRVIGAA